MMVSWRLIPVSSTMVFYTVCSLTYGKVDTSFFPHQHRERSVYMSDIYSCLCRQLVLCQLTHLEALSSFQLHRISGRTQCRLYIIKLYIYIFPLNTLLSVHGGINTDALASVHAIQAKNASYLFHLLSKKCLILSKLYCSVAFAFQTSLLHERLKCCAEVSQKSHQLITRFASRISTSF